MKTKKPPLRRLGSARAGDKVRLKLYWARPGLYQDPAGSVLDPAGGVLLLRTVVSCFYAS
jgi:hypothetical protein